MAFKRNIAPIEFFKGTKLTKAMRGIGMNFSASPLKNVNIEDTLVSASIEGMDCDDLRVLSILTYWIETHYRWINADRLIRIVSMLKSPRVRAYWATIGLWLHTDRRYGRMEKIYKGKRLDLLRTGNTFQIKRFGEDPRFKGAPLRVPANILRRRDSDIISSAQLAKEHKIYQFRIMMGPTYRADMWAELESAPILSPAELARRTYGSFGTAWTVKNDWALLSS